VTDERTEEIIAELTADLAAKDAENERLAATSSAVIATLRMQRDEARAEIERLREDNAGLLRALEAVAPTVAPPDKKKP
jgi:hypothetical protein